MADGERMKARVFGLVALVVSGAIVAAAYLATRDSEASRREAYIARCNEEGAGGMFTSREYCAELYDQSAEKRRSAENSN